MNQDMIMVVTTLEYPIRQRYINQPGKGPSFHTDRFIDGYNDGFDACSDGIGDNNNMENNTADGNLRVIATLDMGTYGNQYCDSRTFDMRVYVRSELAQERLLEHATGKKQRLADLM